MLWVILLQLPFNNLQLPSNNQQPPTTLREPPTTIQLPPTILNNLQQPSHNPEGFSRRLLRVRRNSFWRSRRSMRRKRSR
jgi:hypothetical protein